MGKKASLNDVLAKGKAKNKEAAKAAKAAKEPGLPSTMEVSLKSKLPGGLTLGAFMKQNAVSYEEAVRVYRAYTEVAKAEDKKIKKYGMPTPVRGQKAPPMPAEDMPSKASKRKAKQADVEQEEEIPKASKASKKAKASAGNGDDSVDPGELPLGKVKRSLSFATPDKEFSVSLTRANKKRGNTDAEIRAGTDEAGDAGSSERMKRSNAAHFATPSSSEKPRRGILRGWLLGFIYMHTPGTKETTKVSI